MKKINVLVCLLISLFLTGCFDKVELEERALVLALGIDKYNENLDTLIEKTAEEKRYVVSMAMPEVSEAEKTGESQQQADPMANKDSQQNKNEAIKKGEGASISSTIDLIDTYTSKDLYFGHTKVVILGKDILQNENLLKETIDSLERNKEISSKIIVLASKENAISILETVPKDEKMIGIYINDFYKNNKRNSSFTFRVDLEDVIKNMLSSNGDVAIPTIDILDNDIKLGGTAIINNYKLKGYLDDRQTKGLLWIIDKNSLGELTVSFENTFASIDIFKKNVDMNFFEQNGKIICNISLDIKGNISEYTLNDKTDENIKYELLEKKYSEYLEEEISYSLQSILNLNSDILGLKEKIRKDNYNLYQKYDLQNNNIYDNLIFNIDANLTIKGSGSIK